LTVPELPEVETVARQLAPRLVGRSVRRLRIFDPRLRAGPTPALGGRRVLSVARSGKRVLLEFSARSERRDPLWLAVHLRMTGRLLWTDGAAALDRARLRAAIDLDRGRLWFLDTRRFGTFTWYRSRPETVPDGLDPLSAELTAERLERLLSGSRQSLKAWLLRQDRLAGLGNIYASEILWSARISPFRAAGSLGGAEVRRLHRATRRILERAIRNCGTTFSDFQDVEGRSGSYQNRLAVYDREGRPCVRCGRPIRRTVQQQRSTFDCAACQPGPRSA
jgi:formamidopyrimidine-DNA glycosylase